MGPEVHIGDLAKILLPLFLAVIMFGAGLSLERKDFDRVKQTPWLILLGMLCQYILMPVCALGVVLLLDLEYEYALGVILLGACPGGIMSNLLVFIGRLDLALSVTLTSISTLVCAFVTPAVTFFLAQMLQQTDQCFSVSFTQMVSTVFAIILLPLAVGMLVRHFTTGLALKLERGFRVLGVVFLAALIALIVFQNRAHFQSALSVIGLAVILHNISAFALGYWIPRLLKAGQLQARTVAMEVGLQNTTLAMTLAVQFFTPKVAIPAAIFSLWMIFSGGICAFYWARKGAKEQHCK
ncbi:MAG: bile acid:sodium symporter family protein [Proteobacteria bacterium]|nr:bile acid:sodium symporter family protein [Pseudomonadota bacterium]